ncbi:MAG: hypothetical protein KBS65_06580 [Prevotella sp.]|nr:hypothetical protein [Candidatus Equicola stercoris]
MAVISLRYDARNVIAKKTIDFILSLGVFTREDSSKMSSAEKKTRKAIAEIENGKGIVCNSFEEFLKAVK